MTDIPPGAQWPPVAPDPASAARLDFTRDRVEEDAALSVEAARATPAGRGSSGR